MPNIKLIIAYDGKGFLGWQKTSTGPSIEASLEQALEKILQEPISLQAASRTDAGVHAMAQPVNFLTKKQELNLNKLSFEVNSLLPIGIRVLSADLMPDEFHPTIHSTGKIYHYHLCLGKVQLPHNRFYSWHCPYPLNLPHMHSASEYFLGKQDFSSFCNVKKNNHTTDYVREIIRLDFIPLPDERLRIEIQGNNFLYKMVRNIVGTLVFVGRGKLQADQIPAILKKKDRTVSGMTAPAHGLALYKVFY